MILKLKIRCSKCGQDSDDEYYAMPNLVRVSNEEIVVENSKYNLLCNKCGNLMQLKLEINELK